MRKSLIKIAEYVTACTIILGAVWAVLQFFRADLPPFASQVRAEAIADSVVQLRTETNDATIVLRGRVDDVEKKTDSFQANVTAALLDVQISAVEQRLKEATEDNAKNPTSTTARAVAELTLKLERLRARQRKMEDASP